MLPETSTVAVQNGVVHWDNTGFMISVDEASAVAAEVREKMSKPGVDGILVDNSAANGTWPPEIDDIWGELMADIYDNEIKCATLCPSATDAMHVNRLSRQNDADVQPRRTQRGTRLRRTRFRLVVSLGNTTARPPDPRQRAYDGTASHGRHVAPSRITQLSREHHVGSYSRTARKPLFRGEPC